MRSTSPTALVAGRCKAVATLALAAVSLAACATAPHPTRLAAAPAAGASGYKVGKPYQVRGVWYTPAEQPDYDEVGAGSWYGEQFHNRYTANGEVFDMDRLSAAHKTLPLPCLVEVTNLENGRKVVLRVNDRGPFVDGRIIDLSRAAAAQLGYERQGLAKVRVRYVGPAPLTPPDGRLYQAARPPEPARPKPTATASAEPLPSGWLAQPQYLPDQKPAVLRAQIQAAPASFSGYRVQAGAFSVRANAERAAQQLSGAGAAEIVETERGGGVLYRVLVDGGDSDRVWAVRDQVASLGYPDATVVGGN